MPVNAPISPEFIPQATPLTSALPQTDTILFKSRGLMLFAWGTFHSGDSLAFQVNPVINPNDINKGTWQTLATFTAAGVQIFQFVGNCAVRWVLTSTNGATAVYAAMSEE
jgi:hypothetical protein